MREIKFRALKDDMSNCNFVYGQLVYDAVGCPRITEVDSSGQGLLFHTCLKNTEGQFAGLKDKNGKEIYEGDICQIMLKRKWGHQIDSDKPVIIGTVEFGRIAISNNTLYVFNAFHINGRSLEYELSHDIEVCGNIYETPSNNESVSKEEKK